MATTGTWARVLDETDDETAQLILALQLQDLAALAPPLQGASDGVDPSDDDIARQMFFADLADYCAIRDMEMPQLAATTLQELPATPEPTPSPDDPPSPEALREARIAAFVATLEPLASATGEREREHNPQPEPANHERQKCGMRSAMVDCRACGQMTSWKYTAPCQHNYCDECMQQLFMLALKDETMFPPRCCRMPFALPEAKIFLPEGLRLEFEQKQEELEDSHKVYCHVPTCSAYISASRRLASENFAKCGECDAGSCIMCKGPSHYGECPEDEELEAVLQAAKAAGWQTCKPCGRVLELTQGCYHMTCLCKAEFCYLCAATWKTCDCMQWDENRLLRRAAEIVDDEGGDVAEVAADLRINHDCGRAGHSYRRIHGASQCDDCNHNLPVFINRCSHCRREVCNWCRDRE